MQGPGEAGRAGCPLQGCPAGPGWDEAFSGQAGLTPTSEDGGPHPALSAPLLPTGWGVLGTGVCVCWRQRWEPGGRRLVLTRRCGLGSGSAKGRSGPWGGTLEGERACLPLPQLLGKGLSVRDTPNPPCGPQACRGASRLRSTAQPWKGDLITALGDPPREAVKPRKANEPPSASSEVPTWTAPAHLRLEGPRLSQHSQRLPSPKDFAQATGTERFWGKQRLWVRKKGRRTRQGRALVVRTVSAPTQSSHVPIYFF